MSDRYSSESRKTRSFLAPLTGPPLVPLVPPLPSLEEVLEFVRRGGSAPGQLLGNTPARGTRPPPIPPTDNLASAELPNLLIRVLLQSSRHTTVQGDGVNDSVQGRVVMNWFVDGADDHWDAAKQPIPQPGEVMNLDQINGVYRAVLFDGCLSSAFIPIGLSAVIDIAPGIEIGSFSGFEPEMIRRGGQWAFEFTIRASKDDGAHQSDLRFQGMIDATCTNSRIANPFAN